LGIVALGRGSAVLPIHRSHLLLYTSCVRVHGLGALPDAIPEDIEGGRAHGDGGAGVLHDRPVRDAAHARGVAEQAICACVGLPYRREVVCLRASRVLTCAI